MASSRIIFAMVGEINKEGNWEREGFEAEENLSILIFPHRKYLDLNPGISGNVIIFKIFLCHWRY